MNVGSWRLGGGGVCVWGEGDGESMQMVYWNEKRKANAEVLSRGVQHVLESAGMAVFQTWSFRR